MNNDGMHATNVMDARAPAALIGATLDRDSEGTAFLRNVKLQPGSAAERRGALILCG